MKEKINLLFYMHINKHLPNENYDYYVVEKDGKYIINELPLSFNNYSTILKQYLAYDFDKLSEVHKSLYTNKNKSFRVIENNIYEIDVKKYVIKKNNRK